MRVLVAGDLTLAAVSAIPALPTPGENVLAETLTLAASGVALNVAWALRGLGAEVAVAGAVGADLFGTAILADLEQAAIDCSLIRVLPAPTGFFSILVTQDGERTMVGGRGASACTTLDAAAFAAWRPDWCHISGYTLLNPGAGPALAAALPLLAAHGIPVSVDLEGIAGQRARPDLGGVEVLCSRQEYTRFAAGRSEEAAGKGLACLVVREGAAGCLLVEDGAVTRLPAFSSKAVDCTGAGDAFNAGFIAARLAGHSRQASCSWGNAAGALAVRVRGPRISLPLDALQRLVCAR